MKNNNIKSLVKRYVFLFVGLFVNAVGVTVITKAKLGTSPITSIPYVLDLRFTPTLGQFTFFFNILLVIIQAALLRRRFKAADLLQLPVIFVFSAFIDIVMYITPFLTPQNYALQIVCLLAGCLILGFGVFMEMTADVVMLPGEATVRAITIVFGTDFGKTKVGVDTTMSLTAVLMSFILFGALRGVREGTIISSFLVGTTARFCKKHISGIETMLK